MGAPIPHALLDEHRYPLQQLLAVTGMRLCVPECDPTLCTKHVTARYAAARLGVGETRLYDLLKTGLTEKMADRLACRVASGPFDVWPDWTANAPDFARGQRVAVIDPSDAYCGREGLICRRQEGLDGNRDVMVVLLDGVGRRLHYRPDQLDPLDPLDGVEPLGSARRALRSVQYAGR